MDIYKSAIAPLFNEVFEEHHGIVLDEGTSILNTLASISSEQASTPIVDGGATIAAHAAHIRFYLDALEGYIHPTAPMAVDWSEIWRTVSAVTDEEWNEIRSGVEASYRRMKTLFEGFDSWDDERRLGGAIGIIAHSAYHLGAIRQIMKRTVASA